MLCFGSGGPTDCELVNRETLDRQVHRPTRSTTSAALEARGTIVRSTNSGPVQAHTALSRSIENWRHAPAVLSRHNHRWTNNTFLSRSRRTPSRPWQPALEMGCWWLHCRRERVLKWGRGGGGVPSGSAAGMDVNSSAKAQGGRAGGGTEGLQIAVSFTLRKPGLNYHILADIAPNSLETAANSARVQHAACFRVPAR